MGLARAADLPVVVVGDIDRGGVLAAMYGTLALLDDDDQAHISGLGGQQVPWRPRVCCSPGCACSRSGRPARCSGCCPTCTDVWLDGEDSLALAGWSEAARGPAAAATLSVAVVRFPRISNATDVDALAAEPGVSVRVTADPTEVAAADLVVLPGSRSTLSDLAWMRSRGLDVAVLERAAQRRPVLGICGGYQMLAGTVDDSAAVESPVPASVRGLGLLPTQVRFAPEKQLGTPAGSWRGQEVTAYEIHHGVATLDRRRRRTTTEPAPSRSWTGGTWARRTARPGTVPSRTTGSAARSSPRWRASAGVPWRPAPGAPGFAARREVMLERLADAVEEHLDTRALRPADRRGPVTGRTGRT